jgi:chromatin remodeling complex protein RSC6
MKPLTPSAELAAIVGEKGLPRTEVVKKLWAYIKKHSLQDKVQRRNIHADDNLAPIFKKKVVTMFEMTKLVNKHLS